MYKYKICLECLRNHFAHGFSDHTMVQTCPNCQHCQCRNPPRETQRHSQQVKQMHSIEPSGKEMSPRHRKGCRHGEQGQYASVCTSACVEGFRPLQFSDCGNLKCVQVGKYRWASRMSLCWHYLESKAHMAHGGTNAWAMTTAGLSFCFHRFLASICVALEVAWPTNRFCPWQAQVQQPSLQAM